MIEGIDLLEYVLFAENERQKPLETTRSCALFVRLHPFVTENIYIYAVLVQARVQGI